MGNNIAYWSRIGASSQDSNFDISTIIEDHFEEDDLQLDFTPLIISNGLSFLVKF